MVSSSYFTGNLVGTLLTGQLIKRLGFNRSYYLASLIFAAGCVGLGVMVGFWSWLAWRFVAGVGCAMIWVVVESALMCSGTSRNRGRLLAAYMMIYYVGTFLRAITGQQSLYGIDECAAMGHGTDFGRDFTAAVYPHPESAV